MRLYTLHVLQGLVWLLVQDSHALLALRLERGPGVHAAAMAVLLVPEPSCVPLLGLLLPLYCRPLGHQSSAWQVLVLLPHRGHGRGRPQPRLL